MSEGGAVTIPREAAAQPVAFVSRIVSDQSATQQATSARVECQA